MKTLILGLGKSGRAVYDLLEEEGDFVVGIDDNKGLVEELAQAGKKVSTTAHVLHFDRLILSPGISPVHPIIQEAKALGLPIIGEVHFALERIHGPMIAITGTNGKTTVTLLIAHILQSAGMRAKALGNVGIPLSSYVTQSNASEIAVVELSSYQLETLAGFYFDIGLILNISPDHLDRHGTMEAYAKSKCRLQECMKKEGKLWVNESVVTQFKGLLNRYEIYGKNPGCALSTDQVALLQYSRIELILPNRYRDLGAHESENVLAAWIACNHFGISSEVFLKGLETFEKPSHRIEKVASIQGVDYIDDSKGTNIDATIKAVESMKKPVILIVGGVDKGASYTNWKDSFRFRVRHVLAIGSAAEKIASDLKPEYQAEIFSSLRAAVLRAYQLSFEGDVVLLSPGCASFDMFRDYAHRGDEFKKIVNGLKEIR